MCRIVLIRHGETDWNLVNRVLGRTDMPLNETGKMQAAECAKRIRENVDISVIYTSPLSRAVMTAEAIAAQTGCEIRTDERLIEHNFGIFEGVPRDNPEYQAAKREYFARYPEGESFIDVAARAYSFLAFLKETHPEDTVAVVTHGGVGRVITNYFQDMTNEEFVSFTMKNCEYRIFEM